MLFTVCVFVSLLVSSPPLLGWAEYTFIQKQMFCFCDWTKAPSYAFFMISVCFGIPFGVMTVCNIFIFKTVRDSKRRVTAVTNSSNSAKLDDPEPNSSTVIKDDVSKPHDVTVIINERSSTYPVESSRVAFQSNNNTHEDGNQLKRKNTTLTTIRKKSRTGKSRSEEIRLAMILAIVVVIFVISWLPYCFSMLLEIFARDQVHPAFHMATIMLGSMNEMFTCTGTCIIHL